MLATRGADRYLWLWVGSSLMAGLVMWGCATHEVPEPPQATAEVGRRLHMLEECVGRSQRAVQAATDTGVSAGALAPANSGIADAQDAADEVKQFINQGKVQEASDRAARGLEGCEKIEGMVAKGHQEAMENRARAQMVAEAEGRMPQIVSCIDGARQAMRQATATKATAEALATVRSPLDSAETALKQAREFLAQHDPKSALGRLDTAEEDCKTAQAAGQKVTAMFPKHKATAPQSRRQR